MTPSEQARADAHPCDSCGGSGMIWQWCDESRTRDERVVCPVCLWRNNGRFSDRMPAADAFADAETLRQVAPFERPDELVQWLVWRNVGFQVDASGAREAARAAFRAVPGLRG